MPRGKRPARPWPARPTFLCQARNFEALHGYPNPVSRLRLRAAARPKPAAASFIVAAISWG